MTRRHRAAVLIGVVALALLLLWVLRADDVSPPGKLAATSAPAPATFRKPTELRSAELAAISGTVFDSAGSPVSRVLVAVRGRRPGEPTAAGRAAAGMTTPRPDGRFRVGDLEPGVYSVTATSPDGGSASSEPITLRAGQEADLTLRLSLDGSLITGRVQDVSVGSIEGATITAERRWPPAPEEVPPLLVARSGRNGEFSFRLPPGPYFLSATASGYATSNTYVELKRREVVEFRLTRGATLAGRILDNNRGPASNATVELRLRAETVYDLRTVQSSDGEGRFSFDGLNPGRYTLMGRKGDLVGLSSEVQLAVGEAKQDVELILVEGASATGHVRNGQGQPLPGAAVQVLAMPRGPADRPLELSTDGNGMFSVEGVLPGTFRVSAKKQGHAAVVESVALRLGKNTINLVLEEAATVHGVVRDSAGAPVENAKVGLRMYRGEQFLGYVGTTSGPAGAFELTGIRGTSASYWASHPSSGLGSAVDSFQPHETKQIVITLKPGARVAGIVRYLDGRPAGDVAVWSFSPVPTAAVENDTRTAADGTFDFGPFPAGKAVITSGDPRTKRIISRLDESPDNRVIELKEGEHRRDVLIVIGDGNKTISGRVVGPNSEAVEGATVAADRMGGPIAGVRVGAPQRMLSKRAISGQDGVFKIDALVEGDYTLWVNAPGLAEKRVEGVRTGEEKLVVAMSPTALISGVVLADSGEPVPRYSVAAQVEGADSAEKSSGAVEVYSQRIFDASGAFSLPGLQGGRYVVSATSLDGKSAKLVVDVPPGTRRSGLKMVLR